MLLFLCLFLYLQGALSERAYSQIDTLAKKPHIDSTDIRQAFERMHYFDSLDASNNSSYEAPITYSPFWGTFGFGGISFNAQEAVSIRGMISWQKGFNVITANYITGNGYQGFPKAGALTEFGLLYGLRFLSGGAKLITSIGISYGWSEQFDLVKSDSILNVNNTGRTDYLYDEHSRHIKSLGVPWQIQFFGWVGHSVGIGILEGGDLVGPLRHQSTMLTLEFSLFQ